MLVAGSLALDLSKDRDRTGDSRLWREVTSGVTSSIALAIVDSFFLFLF
jgi:hypothetical protein